MTRKDYLDGKVSFQEYYQTIANDAGIVLDAKDPLVQCAMESRDEHYNDIPVAQWDSWARIYQHRIDRAMRAYGDFLTLAGGVCTLKVAVRAKVEELKRGQG